MQLSLPVPAAGKPSLLAIVLITVAKMVFRELDLSETVREILRWSTEIAELYIALWAVFYVALKVRRTA